MMDYEWQERLEEALWAASDMGRWVLVAYGWQRYSTNKYQFGVMTCSIDNLPDVMGFLERETTAGYRHDFGRHIPFAEMEDLSSKFSAIEVRPVPAPGFDASEEQVQALRALCEQYASARWLERGVALVDICGFTKQSSREQLCDLLSLNYALNTALRRLRKASMASRDKGGPTFALRFQRSTTGDGYYIWNEFWGRHGDAAVLALLLQTLAILEGRRMEPREGLVRVSAAFTVGEIYKFSDRGIHYARHPVGEYIVGPATNDIARILGAAQPGQLLIQDFTRRESKRSEERIGPRDLLDEAIGMLSADLNADFAEKVSAGFRPDNVLRVLDNHRGVHYCLNVAARMTRMESDGKLTIQPVGLEPETAEDLANLAFKAP